MATLRRTLLFLALLTPILFSGPARAQVDPAFSLGTTFQGRFSYGWHEETAATDAQERLGFGIRRARLRGEAIFGSLGAYGQVDAAGSSVTLLDAYLLYAPTGRLQLQLGRLIPAQPRALQFTSHTRMDSFERAAIALRWDDGTLGSSGRDFGLSLQYSAPRADLILSLHNGDGDWSSLRGNVRPGLAGDVTGGADNAGMAVSLYGAYQPAAFPGVEAGGFLGYNAAKNPSTEVSEGFFAGTPRTYTSYAGHLYWGAHPGSQPLRLKADLIGIRCETLTVPPTVDLPPGTQIMDDEQHVLGLSLLGAARFHRAGELFGRIERFDPNTDTDENATHYLTFGANFSLSALYGQPYRNQRLTLAYGTVLPEASGSPNQHLIALQLQLVL